MIKFFRNIRQRLLIENNAFNRKGRSTFAVGMLNKYLIYAIGEIVLVVIGIVIALQINNWNISKQYAYESHEFSNRLLNEVRNNVYLVDNQIEEMRQRVSSTLDILKMFDRDKLNLSASKLDSLIYNSIGHSNIQLNLGTLEEGLNTGKIALIKSDSLRTLLYSFPSKVEVVKDYERYTNDDIDDNFVPFLYKNFSYRKMDGNYSPYKEQIGTTQFSEHDHLKVMSSMQFESLIDNRFFNSNRSVEKYQELNQELIKLETLIVKSIKLEKE
jgi:hypothetical protein